MSMLNNPMVKKAMAFAKLKHGGQVRKYTGEDYVVHPIEVAELVTAMLNEVTLHQMYKMGNFSVEEAYVAALLHDVVEDCGVSNIEIAAMFGANVALIVEGLTDDKLEGNRAARKEKMLRKHNSMPAIVRFIKVCDLIHNMRSIMTYDIDFGVVFLKEIKVMRNDILFMHNLPDVAKLMLDTHIAFAECIVQKHLQDKEKA